MGILKNNTENKVSKKVKLLTKFNFNKDNFLNRQRFMSILQKIKENKRVFNPLYSNDIVFPFFCKKSISGKLLINFKSAEYYIFYQDFMTKLNNKHIGYTKFLYYFKRFGLISPNIVEEHIYFNKELGNLMLLFLYHSMKYCDYNLDDSTVFYKNMDIKNPPNYIIRAYNIACLYNYRNISPEHIIFFLLNILGHDNNKQELYVLFHRMFPEYTDIVEQIHLPEYFIMNNNLTRYQKLDDMNTYLFMNNEQELFSIDLIEKKFVLNKTNDEEIEYAVDLLTSLK